MRLSCKRSSTEIVSYTRGLIFAKNTKMQKRIPVAQHNPMGCAVACVASFCQISYEEALRLFSCPKNAWIRGYFCNEVADALSNFGVPSRGELFDSGKHFGAVLQEGTIVYIAPNDLYTSGHYLLKLTDGWMNPWANFPSMMPVRAAIVKTLPGNISHIIYQII